MTAELVPNPFQPQEPNILGLPSVPEAQLAGVPESVSVDVIMDPTSEIRGIRNWLHIAKRTGQMALVGLEMTPGVNEGARLALFSTAEAMTHGSNPLLAGAVAGISTFAIEAAGGAAGASLLETSQADWLLRKTNTATAKLRIPNELSKTTKLGFTFLGGTNVGMILEQRENGDRTYAQNQRYNLITSAWLGGSLAVLGYAAAEGINVAVDNPQTAGLVTGGLMVTAVARKLKKRLSRHEAGSAEQLRDFDKKHGIAFTVPVDADKLDEIATLEQNVWYAKGYGSLADYAEHIEHSVTLGASQNDEMIGMARMFDGTKKMPPFLEMDFYDQDLKAEIMQQSTEGKIVEMGTLAKLESAPRGAVMRGLLRMFYREAKRRGAENMACIMEPERVQNINKHYGLVYEQVGPAIPYQGGDCAPHIMNIDKAEKNMRRKHPLAYYWFVKQALKS